MKYYFNSAVCGVFVWLLAMTAGHAQGQNIVSPAIVINLPACMLELYSGNTLIKEYPVAIGSMAKPTPLGVFAVREKEVNPKWMKPGTTDLVPSGPDNPLGYRWIGFLELYGIHGTNTPWTIGKVVSSGCIRMRESDVEELYEAVSYGTPITIKYERVKVAVDREKLTVTVYPDVYRYKEVTVAEVWEQLTTAGFKDWIQEDALQKLVRENRGQPETLLRYYPLQVNKKVARLPAVKAGDTLYVPALAAGELLQQTITWDAERQLVSNGQRQVRGMMKGGHLYISETDCRVLFGGEQSFGEENGLGVNVLVTVVNGKPLGWDTEKIEGIPAVPVLELAKRQERKVQNYDEAGKRVLIEGVWVPVTQIAGRPYLDITRICDYFNADVYWDEPGYLLEITYPSRLPQEK